MSRPYRLSTRTPLAPDHPLHWTRFWPDLQRLHRSKIEARQDLVLWLANLYHGTIRCGKPAGFCSVQVELTKLREWVRDYRPALEYFFDVKQLGFRLDDENRELTTLTPKLLKPSELSIVDKTAGTLKFSPPQRPDDSVVSKVYLRPGLDAKDLVARVLRAGRPELVPQLTWLLEQNPEQNFHFIRSGKLKLRDTSVWPISGIETWPAWLREELFGGSIDLDAAYIQFLLQLVRSAYADTPHMVELLFPDLVRLLDDKEAFRRELCSILKLEYNDENRGVIKRVIMSIANGSKVSAGLLLGGSGFSQTARLVNETAPEATSSELIEFGDRLQRISAQFTSAKKRACLELQGQLPNRKNVKKVFGAYFEWERRARYALWEAIGRHGIMVHDGIDGVPDSEIARLPELIETLGLRLTA